MADQLGPSARVERSTTVTADPERARQLLDRLYGADVRVDQRLARSGPVSVEVVDAGRFTTTDLRLPFGVDAGTAGTDDAVLFTTVAAGRVEYRRRAADTRYGVGDVFVANAPGVDWSASTAAFTGRGVRLDVALLRDTAGLALDVPLRLHATEPVPARRRQWRDAVRFVEDLLAEPGSADSALLVGSAARLLAATALTVFPTNFSPPTAEGDRRDAHPDTLRRAVAFIEANPDLDLDVSDIARAARVTPRAVQLVFRRHLDTTPLGYLRQVRLAHARDDLRRASAGDGATVTTVASRWGFSSSRFPTQYRDAFGESPSQTLRSTGTSDALPVTPPGVPG